MNPYAPIKTEPLVDKGDGTLSAYSTVQIEVEHTNKETGGTFKQWEKVKSKPVHNNYLLIPNQDVRDIVLDLASQTTWEWSDTTKTFFDGKRYMITKVTEEIQSEVSVGDAVSLGIGAWNSYDGSKAFSLFMFINRLICDNGMMSKDMFNTFRFTHTLNNAGWKDEAENAFKYLQKGPEKIKEWTEKAQKLKHPLTCVDDLRHIRENAIPDIPVTTFGKITDQFLSEEEQTGWGFLNAGTNVLWHSKTPTVSMYEQNAQFTDAMLNYNSIR
jgi:hypothetical protein